MSLDLSGAIVCATVTDGDGKVIYDHNGSLMVSPASNEKLFSASFALWELGPNYRPQTNLWKLSDRTVVESNGDPSLSFASLDSAAKTLGLDRTLPVYVKEGYAPQIPGTWELGDLPNRYAAPVSAFSVDQSAFVLWNDNGKPVLRPDAYGVKVVHEDPKAAAPSFDYDPIERRVVYRGAFKNEQKELDTLAVPKGDEAAALILGSSFHAIQSVPDVPPSLSVQGKPLAEILADCLRASDNNMAENLLLMGALHERALPADAYSAAILRLKEFLTRVVQLQAGQFLPVDGSGLTRSNLETTQGITALLRWADKQPTASAWRNALARPGLGTLRRRLAGIEFQGKTGSLSHVTALSGYLRTASGKRLVVSVILNNFTCSDERAHQEIDAFVKNLAGSVK